MKNTLADRHKIYFHAVAENGHEVIVLINRKGQILYVSPSVKKIYTVDPKDMVGRNIADFIYNKDTEAISEYLKNVIKPRHENYVTEFSYKHTDNSIYSLEATATNMLTNPNVSGIILIVRDITLKKKTETLKETEKLLEKEKLKTEFIANATHEIRTPLAIIKGNVDLALIKGAKENNFIRDRFKAINHEIEHLSYMLSDLALLTSNREKIKNRIVFKETDLSKIIKHITGALRVLAEQKHISIKIKNNPQIILNGNDAYLEKMLANIVKNAITYGKENGWVSIDSVKKNNKVEIKISDNGIGIGENDLPNIFERFYKVDKSHSLYNKRFGLGLAIVKWIVSTHNGTIDVESQLNKGSTFIVSLPMLNKN